MNVHLVRAAKQARFAATAGMVGVAMWLSGCSRGAPPAMPERPPSPVRVAEAIARDVPRYLDEIGRCVAREMVIIQPQVSGRLTQIAFTDGAELKSGDLLFAIDARPFQAQLDEAKASVAQNRATLALAKLDFERVRDLRKENPKAISKQDFDTRENAVAVGEARTASAEAAVATAALNLEYCSIRAPIDGRAGQRLADVGNIVKANETSLLVIQRLDPIYADFTVTERDLPAVREHMKQRTLKAQVGRPDDREEPREGDLTFLDNAVKDGSGTVKLRATLPNADRRFWAGQFVNVRLVLETKVGAVLVPSQAVQIGQKGPYVFVVKPDFTSEQRNISPGQRQGDLIAIDEGLRAGETIVTDGQIAVMDGGKVRVVDGKEGGAGRP